MPGIQSRLQDKLAARVAALTQIDANTHTHTHGNRYKAKSVALDGIGLRLCGALHLHPGIKMRFPR